MQFKDLIKNRWIRPKDLDTPITKMIASFETEASSFNPDLQRLVVVFEDGTRCGCNNSMLMDLEALYRSTEEAEGMPVELYRGKAGKHNSVRFRGATVPYEWKPGDPLPADRAEA